jgi:hypothetical protein
MFAREQFAGLRGMHCLNRPRGDRRPNRVPAWTSPELALNSKQIDSRENVPTTLLFSCRSKLLQKCGHLIENKGQEPFCKPFVFYQFRTPLHSSPGSPLFSIRSPKHTGGIPPSARGNIKTLLEVSRLNPGPLDIYKAGKQDGSLPTGSGQAPASAAENHNMARTGSRTY